MKVIQKSQESAIIPTLAKLVVKKCSSNRMTYKPIFSHVVSNVNTNTGILEDTIMFTFHMVEDTDESFLYFSIWSYIHAQN